MHIQSNMLPTFHLRLNRFSRDLTAHFDQRLKGLGLAVSYIELLISLDENGECSQKFLGEELHLAPSTITRFLQKLETKELLTRRKKGYVSLVSLTPKGKKIAERGKVIYKEAWQEVLHQVGDKYAETTGKLLEYGRTEIQKMETNKQ